MISLRRSFAMLAALLAASAVAQEVAPPTTPGDNATTGPAGAASPSLRGPIEARAPSGGVLPSRGAAASDTPLLPDQTPSLEEPAPERKKPTKSSKTEAFEQDIKERIRFREVKVVALADAGVQAEWARAAAARTDGEKRAAMQKYYKLLYARMAKLDSSIKKLIDAEALLAERRLMQTRVSPTEVVDAGDRSTAARVFAE